MNADEIGALVWIGLVAVAFVVRYRSTKKNAPHSRLEPKALVRSSPWAFLFASSMAFGAIPLPMPAGLLIVGWIWSVISHTPTVQGPHNATGPIVCIALTISWALILPWCFSGFDWTRKHEKNA